MTSFSNPPGGTAPTPPRSRRCWEPGTCKHLDDVQSGPTAAPRRPVADVALLASTSAPAWRDTPSWGWWRPRTLTSRPQVQIFVAGAKATSVTADAFQVVAVSHRGDGDHLIDEAVRATG